MFRLRGELEHVLLMQFSSPMPCALLRTHHPLFHSSFLNLRHSVFKQFVVLNCCSHFKINLKGKAFFCANVKTGKFSPQTSIWCIWLALHGNISPCGFGDQIQAIDHAGQPLCWAAVPSAHIETFHFYKYRIWFIFVEVACPLSWWVHYCSVVMIKYHYQKQLKEQQFSTWGLRPLCG